MLRYGGALQPRDKSGYGGVSNLRVSVAAADCFAHSKAKLLRRSVSKSYSEGRDAHRPAIGEGASFEGEVRWQTSLHCIRAEQRDKMIHAYLQTLSH